MVFYLVISLWLHAGFQRQDHRLWLLQETARRGPQRKCPTPIRASKQPLILTPKQTERLKITAEEDGEQNRRGENINRDRAGAERN